MPEQPPSDLDQLAARVRGIFPDQATFEAFVRCEDDTTAEAILLGISRTETQTPALTETQPPTTNPTQET